MTSPQRSTPRMAMLIAALWSACPTKRAPPTLKDALREPVSFVSTHPHALQVWEVWEGSTRTNATPAAWALYARKRPRWANADECIMARWGLRSRTRLRMPPNCSTATPHLHHLLHGRSITCATDNFLLRLRGVRIDCPVKMRRGRRLSVNCRWSQFRRSALGVLRRQNLERPIPRMTAPSVQRPESISAAALLAVS